MPSYVLKLYGNDGLASREMGSIAIEANDNISAITAALGAPIALTNNFVLAVLMGADGTPIWLRRLNAS